MKSLLLTFVISIAFYKTCSGVSLCMPNSQYKLDCNTCKCSDDGKYYSCTRMACFQSDEDNAPVNAPVLRTRELVDSQESWENEFSDEEDNNIPIDSDEDRRIDINHLQDVSLSEQDAEILDGSLPNYFRFRRNIS